MNHLIQYSEHSDEPIDCTDELLESMHALLAALEAESRLTGDANWASYLPSFIARMTAAVAELREESKTLGGQTDVKGDLS